MARLIGRFPVFPTADRGAPQLATESCRRSRVPATDYYKDMDVADRSASAERGLARPTGFDHDPIKLNQIVIASLCSA
jgi:hypothetical protein